MNRTHSFIIRLCAFPLASLMAITPAAAEKPVKVYILAGQSNMVGIGQVDGGGTRLAQEMTDLMLSLYAGTPDANMDYDTQKPEKTMEIAAFGGTEPISYPKEGVAVLRGQIEVATTGMYELRPGYGASEECIMVVDGKEVHRKLPGTEAVRTEIKLEAGKKVPFKITHLNQSGNAIGWIARMDIPGTLKSVVKYDGKFKYLTDEKGSFIPRDDVWYTGVVTATANKWLDIGCGASATSIGPELGFGHMVGNHHDEPVLILKASQGNRSLGWDFLPPGSEGFEATDEKGVTWVYAGYKQTPDRWVKGTEPKPVEWYAGKQYDDCFNAAKEVLAKFDEKYPQWKGRGYEIAGFGWWQGHKDTGSEITAGRYEQNLVNLIKALRKDFNVPNAPFVVAVGCGNEGREGPGLTVANAQLAVDGGTGKYPEFKGNVKTVDTRDFFPKVENSPRDQGFHYHGNAETYMLVGEVMGKAMLELQK